MTTKTTTRISTMSISDVAIDAGSDLRASDPTREYTDGSTTRKYISNAETSLRSNVVVDEQVKTNSDVIVETAVKLSTIATTMPSIAEVSRDALSMTREMLSSVKEDTIITKETIRPSQDEMMGRIKTSAISSIESIVAKRKIEDSIVPLRPLIEQKQETIVTKSTTKDIQQKPGFLGSSEERISSAVNQMISKTIESGRSAISFSQNTVIPNIESVALMESAGGSIDKFVARVMFTVDTKDMIDANIKGFRIFRAQLSGSKMTRKSNKRVSLTAMNEMRSMHQSLSKTESSVIMQSKNLQSAGIDNVLISNTALDEITNVWYGSARSLVSSSIDKSINTSSESSKLLVSEFISSEEYSTLDKSVAEDLNTLRNIQLQDPKSITRVETENVQGLSVISRDSIDNITNRQIMDSQKRLGTIDSLSRTRKNSLGFSEIAFLPAVSTSRIDSLGMSKMYVDDKTIEYGKAYAYYVVSVDSRMIESIRSKLSRLKVEVLIVPDAPESIDICSNGVVVSISILHRDNKIEKFEIYRKSSAGENDNYLTQTINGSTGYIVDSEIRSKLKNGFVQIGEVLNSTMGTNSFIDRDVIDGNVYTYRVYSVDIYGNKSSEPLTKEIIVGDSLGIVPPTLIVEQDAKSTFMRITMGVDDDRIVALFLSRRDITINQQVFTVPNQPSRFLNGMSTSISRINDLGSIVPDQDSWNGFFYNDGHDSRFIDTLTVIDHMYQYMLYGVSRDGRKTSCVFSAPKSITRRHSIESPLNLRATMSSSILKIEWDQLDNSVSPYELIGDRDVLNKTKSRIIYQVERKPLGSGDWQKFPLTDNKYIDETIGTGLKRSDTLPKELEKDSTYIYRVASYQSGGYISNYSDMLRVSTKKDVLAPLNFKVSYQDINVSPFFVSLSWDDASGSTDVDRWSIERAEINNFVASSIDMSDPNVLSKMIFLKLSDIYAESSRFRSRDSDMLDSDTNISRSTTDTLKGKRHFIDRDVSFGNTYVYRIMAFGSIDGSSSNYSYRGIRITSPSFEDKIGRILTDDDKINLSKNIIPLKLRNDIV